MPLTCDVMWSCDNNVKYSCYYVKHCTMPSFTFLMNSKYNCSLLYSASSKIVLQSEHSHIFTFELFCKSVAKSLFYFSLCFFVKLISLPLSLFLIQSSRNNSTHWQWLQ